MATIVVSKLSTAPCRMRLAEIVRPDDFQLRVDESMEQQISLTKSADVERDNKYQPNGSVMCLGFRCPWFVQSKLDLDLVLRRA